MGLFSIMSRLNMWLSMHLALKYYTASEKGNYCYIIMLISKYYQIPLYLHNQQSEIYEY